MRASLLLALLLVVATLTGCSSSDERFGRLIVTEQRATGATVYAEGSVGFAEARRTDGSVAARGLREPGESMTTPILDRRLPAATYRVISYQRSCRIGCTVKDFNTDQLDPFRSRPCQRTISVPAGSTVEVVVELGRKERCRITVRDTISTRS